MSVSDNEKQIDYLAEKYITQEIDRDESARLLSLLERNVRNAEALHENILADTLLKDIASEDDDLLVLPDVRLLMNAEGNSWGNRLSHRSVFLLFAVLLAVFLLAGVFFGFSFLYIFNVSQPSVARQTPQTPHRPIVETVRQIPEETTTTAVAVVSKLVNAVWKSDQTAFGAGSIVSPGWLRLDSGMARIQFFSGVNVVIEGPTDFMIVGHNRAYCSSGNIQIEVPEQAQGFTINVPQMTVIDRGTAFSMLVGSETSEVRVIKGKVDLTEIPGGLEQLHEGDAAVVDSEGMVRRFRIEEAGATLAQTFDEAVLASQNDLFLKWQETRREIARNPTTLVYFDMEFLSNNDYRLLNNAEIGKRIVGDGIVVGCQKGKGHLPQKESLEFRQISDRVRFHIPNRLFSFTIMTRIRVDSVDRLFHCILSSEDRSAGKISWTICRENSPNGVPYLRFSVYGKEDETVHYDTDAYFVSSRLGQWIELAVVVNDVDKTVSQYADGRLLNRLPLKHVLPVQIGRAELCNWSSFPEDATYQVRHFSGGMDELIIFSDSLSRKEIRQFHQSYSP